jgi:hypothetical protein
VWFHTGVDATPHGDSCNDPYSFLSTSRLLSFQVLSHLQVC